MGILSWLGTAKRDDDFPAADVFEDHMSKPPLPARPEPPKDLPEPDHAPPSDLTFDDIVDNFDHHRNEAIESRAELKLANEKLQQSLSENENIKNALQQIRLENQRLHGVVDRQRKELATSHRLNKAAKELQQAQQGVLDKLRATSRVDQEKLQSQVIYLSDKVQDLQLDLDLLKCTGTSTTTGSLVTSAPTTQMQLTPQPFVVVLIDGDAYGWAHDIFKAHSVRSPGALAAVRLKNAVVDHMLENGTIPDTSRVIARVYINASGKQNHSKKRQAFKHSPTDLLTMFRMQFTETIPLFDFVDVGHGKERADEKVRAENFNLLLSNPYCHRIFLAACTDNGFARMLEQYQYHTAAYEKIILVSPGYVESEIARLGFRIVLWPSVFAKKEAGSKQVDQQKQRMFEAQARLEMEMHHQRLKLKGIRDQRAAEMVKLTVQGKWDGKVVLGGQVGRLGLNMVAAHHTPRAICGVDDVARAQPDEKEVD